MGWDDRTVSFAIFSYYLIVLLDSMKSLGGDRSLLFRATRSTRLKKYDNIDDVP